MNMGSIRTAVSGPVSTAMRTVRTAMEPLAHDAAPTAVASRHAARDKVGLVAGGIGLAVLGAALLKHGLGGGSPEPTLLAPGAPGVDYSPHDAGTPV